MSVSVADRISYAYSAGFRNTNAVEGLTVIVAISLAECGVGSSSGCEGGCNADAGAQSCGVLQIYQPAHPGTAACAADPACCFRIGYQLSGGTGFGAWSTFSNGAFRQHLDPVRAAIASFPPPIGPAVSPPPPQPTPQPTPLPMTPPPTFTPPDPTLGACPDGFALAGGVCIATSGSPPASAVPWAAVALIAAAVGLVGWEERARLGDLRSRFDRASEPIRHAAGGSLERRAIAHYGITDDLREAGFLTPNGTLLDLSGRHQMGGYARVNDRWVIEGGGRDYQAGVRQVDHREVDDLIPQGGNEALEVLENAGFVRLMPARGGELSVSFTRPLTDAQRRVLLGFARDLCEFNVEVYGPTGHVIHSSPFDTAPTPTSVGRALREADAAAATNPPPMGNRGVRQPRPRR